MRTTYPFSFSRAFFTLLVLLVWSNVRAENCPSGVNLPDRLVPVSGEQWAALKVRDPDWAEAAHIALWPEEVVHALKYRPPQKMADRGFDHNLGMWNATMVYPCDRGRPALIEIRHFEVVRLDGEKFVTELKLDFASGQSFAGGGFWKRDPKWFVSGEAPWRSSVVDVTGGVFRLDLRSVPGAIVHMWTERNQAKPGAIYGIRAEVRITGDARIQLAMDYWRGLASSNAYWTPNCLADQPGKAPPDNCEAWLSNWLGDTGGKFIWIVAPMQLIGKSAGHP